MNYREIQTPQGSLEYVAYDNHVELSGYRGKDIRLTVPDLLEDKPVTGVLKKAFLSAKTIRELKLPYSVSRIDDFAFAFCSNLKSIYLSEQLTEMGISIFKECDELHQIHVLAGDSCKEGSKAVSVDPGAGHHLSEQDVEKRESDFSFLLASTAGILEAPYLFRPDQVYQPDWITLWDKRMMSILEVDDMEGYSKMLLCGEEDYGSNETHPEVYRNKRRKAKVRLCMLRLMHDYALSPENKDYLRAYLKSHRKGEESEETWEVVLQEHGDEREYYELLTEIDCVTMQNLPDMLLDMKDRHAEMKAFLLKYRDGQSAADDFFDGLSL